MTVEELLQDWPQDQAAMKEALLELKKTAEALPGIKTEFVPRPGVSYSLRYFADPPAKPERPLFAMVDVVDYDTGYFLSVCFYAELISDPDELGDIIPEGLLGEDGYCFDLDEPDPGMTAYLAARITQAHGAAKA